MRLEEQQIEAEAAAAAAAAAEREASMHLIRPKPMLPSEIAAFNGDFKGRSLSISHPADPNMVSYKLSRFLQSQQASRDDPNQPVDGEAKSKGLDDSAKPFGRFQSDLPNRLREAFARRRGESTDLYLRPPLKHSHTMSLGLPSSGGPFGPEVFSALDLIRANSDEGPSKPPSEGHAMPEKPLSDSEALPSRVEPFLAKIAEDDAEQEAEMQAELGLHGAPKDSGSGSWKDLGRGFGYEVAPLADGSVPQGSSKQHARKTSRISVSTSRRDGDESEEQLLSDDEDVEIRTNPSEDADASDFEDEAEEYGEEHWRNRRASAHLSAFGDLDGQHGYDEISIDSEEDSLRDSLTPSDEQFSNPSDEEAASKERILRRQHRAAERAARQERKDRQRGRANTNNTLPSSSIGEGDLLEQSRYGYDDVHAYRYPQHERVQRLNQEDIISNPSDEVQSDLDDTQTFGGMDRQRRADEGSRLSQDFRFPPPRPSAANAAQTRSSNGPTMSGTLGRASGISMLNPDAKEFKFGGAASATSTNRTVSAPVTGKKHDEEVAPGHFRLPSIKTSSFGSSALGDMPASNSAPHLNVGAPAFTPGSFTFQAPYNVRLQVPEQGKSNSNGASSDVDGDADHDDSPENREMQGREKRTRYGPIDYNSGDDHEMDMYSTSPPRPKASAASIEGPLRSFSSLARHGPPPFLPAGFGQQQRAVSHESRFTPDVPSFVPTWARDAQAFSGSASFKRPTLPDWGQQGQDGAAATPSIRDPSFFTMGKVSKAIPIRRPSEPDQPGPQQEAGKRSMSQDRLTTDSAIASSSVSPQQTEAQAAALDAGQTSTETLKPRGTWSRAMRPESALSLHRARPMQIPVGAHSYQSSSAASMASDAAAGPSVRWSIRHAPSSSRDSHDMSSVDRRVRRTGHGNAVVSDGDEDEDESLTDFVDEIADRIDKALEGWAARFLMKSPSWVKCVLAVACLQQTYRWTTTRLCKRSQDAWKRHSMLNSPPPSRNMSARRPMPLTRLRRRSALCVARPRPRRS